MAEARCFSLEVSRKIIPILGGSDKKEAPLSAAPCFCATPDAVPLLLAAATRSLSDAPIMNLLEGSQGCLATFVPRCGSMHSTPPDIVTAIRSRGIAQVAIYF